ncbi:MAG: riboflavin synthase [Cytophagales bacterium]|nr:riboflavin synthase [Bernardetiaceae bacterium]MDW8204510.1 riboflavin synthase [Cytophagales bacterium]
MFTGIIEAVGKVIGVRHDQGNIHFQIASPISDGLKIDQSVAHNGVCLTVVALAEHSHTVTAVHETLAKTNLGRLQTGMLINLERCMPANGRFDGHFVQGHVDQTGICTHIAEENGSWRYTFAYDTSTGNFTVEKGSIAVNGVSLTVVNSKQGEFSVAIIPYTYAHTTFHTLRVGDLVNLEFDILGKYIKRIMELHLPTLLNR